MVGRQWLMHIWLCGSCDATVMTRNWMQQGVSNIIAGLTGAGYPGSYIFRYLAPPPAASQPAPLHDHGCRQPICAMYSSAA